MSFQDPALLHGAEAEQRGVRLGQGSSTSKRSLKATCWFKSTRRTSAIGLDCNRKALVSSHAYISLNSQPRKFWTSSGFLVGVVRKFADLEGRLGFQNFAGLGFRV